MAATVNGEPITARDFEMAYRNAEESLLRNNPGLTREQLKAQQLGRQVLRDLVTQSLLRQEAARMGISVSPLELRLAVGQIKAFQNDKGDFDPAAYKRVLQAQRLGFTARIDAADLDRHGISPPDKERRGRHCAIPFST